MTNTSDTIVFFGSGPVAAKSLTFLADHFTVEAVITKARPSHHHDAAPVETLARQRSLPLLFANTKTELDTLVVKHPFKSSLGVIVDFGVIVSQLTIDAFKLGILNSHFSLLPRWRGADPISFAILEGDKKTGVSLMLIEPTLDTGKILTQKSITIEQDDTTPRLTDKLIALSNKLLGEYIPLYLTGKIKPRLQPHQDRATYSRKLTKDDGLISWDKPAQQIEREIRAFQGWPSSHTVLNGKAVKILQAKVVPYKSPSPGLLCNVNGELHIECGQDSLRILRLQVAGKKPITGTEYLRGYKI